MSPGKQATRGEEFRDIAGQLLGDEWADESASRVVVELAHRYADPAEVKLALDAILRDREGRYSEDETVDEIVREVLRRHSDSIGLQSFQAIVRSVAGVRQRSTVKGYIQDAVQDGPLRPDRQSLNRFIIEDTDEEGPV